MIDIWLVLGIVATLMVWSFFFYKNTVIFRIIQELITAIILANVVVVALQNINKFALTPVMQGNLILIVPMILGTATYLQLSKKGRYYSQLPVALVLGIGIGIAVQGALSTDIASQVVATMLPIGGNIVDSVNNVIFILCTLLTIMYFMFSGRMRTGVPSKFSTAGRYIVLWTIGAIFGVVAYSRFALLIGRLQYILQALGLIP